MDFGSRLSSNIGEFKSSLLGQKKEPTLADELTSFCPSLSMKQRLIGFGICLGLALLLCFLAVMFLPSIALNPSAFAVPYSLGNIMAICSTAFLVGPMRQLKMMMNPNRIIATIIYLVALILTLVAAFVLKSQLLVLVAVIIQFCALVWYCLSYIPFARQLLSGLCSNAMSA